MAFKKDQKVKIKDNAGGKIIEGVILSKLEEISPLDFNPCYWVQFPTGNDSYDVSLFYESELIELNKEVLLEYCTCGAKYTSTHIHYEWCDSIA